MQRKKEKEIKKINKDIEGIKDQGKTYLLIER